MFIIISGSSNNPALKSCIIVQIICNFTAFYKRILFSSQNLNLKINKQVFEKFVKSVILWNVSIIWKCWSKALSLSLLAVKAQL